TSPTGLITIAGGKLTGYRKMAERVTDIVASRFAKQYTIGSCHTDTLILKGGNLKEAGGLRSFIMQKTAELALYGITEDTAVRLIRLYGTQTYQYIKELENIHPGLMGVQLPDWLKAQLQYTIKHELVCKPDDFIIRRTADFYFRRADVVAYSAELLKAMSILLQWNDATYAAYTEEWNALLKK
ncbi:MAG: glycerol-3-phosphate dehydrogenase/oxidase, partial [Cytophagales bacterium]|nr:glycerol-3-phosphate dehydrogenase/oxidase [Cytophaga sp.]